MEYGENFLTCTDTQRENANEGANSSYNYQGAWAHCVEGRANLDTKDPGYEGVDGEYPAERR